MANQELITLDVDLEELLPGDIFTIGKKKKQDVIIYPLSLKRYTILLKKLKSLYKSILEQGVNKDNYNDIDNIVIIAETILKDFPQILEETSGISFESLELLPPEIIVALVTKIIEVNTKSKDVLLGNYASLTSTIEKLFPAKKKKK